MDSNTHTPVLPESFGNKLDYIKDVTAPAPAIDYAHIAATATSRSEGPPAKLHDGSRELMYREPHFAPLKAESPVMGIYIPEDQAAYAQEKNSNIQQVAQEIGVSPERLAQALNAQERQFEGFDSRAWGGLGKPPENLNQLTSAEKDKATNTLLNLAESLGVDPNKLGPALENHHFRFGQTGIDYTQGISSLANDGRVFSGPQTTQPALSVQHNNVPPPPAIDSTPLTADDLLQFEALRQKKSPTERLTLDDYKEMKDRAAADGTALQHSDVSADGHVRLQVKDGMLGPVLRVDNMVAELIRNEQLLAREAELQHTAPHGRTNADAAVDLTQFNDKPVTTQVMQYLVGSGNAVMISDGEQGKTHSITVDGQTINANLDAEALKYANDHGAQFRMTGAAAPAPFLYDANPAPLMPPAQTLAYAPLAPDMTVTAPAPAVVPSAASLFEQMAAASGIATSSDVTQPAPAAAPAVAPVAHTATTVEQAEVYNLQHKLMQGYMDRDEKIMSAIAGSDGKLEVDDLYKVQTMGIKDLGVLHDLASIAGVLQGAGVSGGQRADIAAPQQVADARAPQEQVGVTV